MEPDFSGCAFLGQEPNPVQKVEEEGVAFHTENQMPPTVAILDLGCTRAMGSRNAVNAFCDYVDNHDCGLSYKIFLCELATNQVHREAGDSHVW